MKIKTTCKDFAGNIFSIQGANFKESIGRSDWYACCICRKDLAKRELKYVYNGWHLCERCAKEHEVIDE